jgi:hypothetical protein
MIASAITKVMAMSRARRLMSTSMARPSAGNAARAARARRRFIFTSTSLRSCVHLAAGRGRSPHIVGHRKPTGSLIASSARTSHRIALRKPHGIGAPGGGELKPAGHRGPGASCQSEPDRTRAGLLADALNHGMAGIGRSALTVHAAHALKQRFPDGQVFLPRHGIPSESSRRSDDLHRRCARPRLHRPHIWRHQDSLRPGLVRAPSARRNRTSRSATCGSNQTLIRGPTQVASRQQDGHAKRSLP